jgi:integrase
MSWRSDVGPRGANGRRKSVYFRTDVTGAPLGKDDTAAAKKKLRAYVKKRDEDEEAGAVGLSDPTVDQIRLLWLSHVKREFTHNSYNSAKSILNQFGAFRHPTKAKPYRELPASALTEDDLERFLAAKQKLGRKPAYLADIHATVQAAFNSAASKQPGRDPVILLPNGNPVKDCKAPRVPVSPERFASRQTIASFLKGWRGVMGTAKRPSEQSTQVRYMRLTALLLRVLIRTGCRPGEACKAQWADVRWDAGRTSAGHTFAKIVLPASRWKAGTKTGKPRTVRLPPALSRALRREFNRPDRHAEHIFVHRSPNGVIVPWTSGALGERIRMVRRKAIKMGFKLLSDEGPERLVAYLFRHTAASVALMHGIGEVTTAELLGTSSVMLKKHYGHLLEGHLDAAAETMAGARRPVK